MRVIEIQLTCEDGHVIRVSEGAQIVFVCPCGKHFVKKEETSFEYPFGNLLG